MIAEQDLLLQFVIAIYAAKHLLLTSRVRSYLVQTSSYRLVIDVNLSQYLCLQQRDVAFLEVRDDRAGDVLTFVRRLRLYGRQTPLTSNKHTRQS